MREYHAAEYEQLTGQAADEPEPGGRA